MKSMRAVIMSEVCKVCPIQQSCCNSPTLPLTPDELPLFKNDANTKVLRASVMQEGWCQHFNQETRLCNLGDKRPKACKMYVCRSINEKLPTKRRALSVSSFENYREKLGNLTDAILRLSDEIRTVTIVDELGDLVMRRVAKGYETKFASYSGDAGRIAARAMILLSVSKAQDPQLGDTQFVVIWRRHYKSIIFPLPTNDRLILRIVTTRRLDAGRLYYHVNRIVIAV